MEKHRIALILPLRSVRAVDRGFDYLCDDFPLLAPGDIVLIPFGKDTANLYGVVVSVRSDLPSMKLKSVSQVLDSRFRLPAELLQLADYLRSQCFCTAGEAIRAMLPSGIRLKTKTVFYAPDPPKFRKALEEPDDFGEEKSLWVFCGEDRVKCPETLAERLIKEKIIAKRLDFAYSVNEKKIRHYRLTAEADDSQKVPTLLPCRNREKYEILLDCLRQAGDVGLTLKEVHDRTGIGKSPLDTLKKLGLAEEYEREIFRSAYGESGKVSEEILLNEEQEAAYSAISEASRRDAPGAFLLYGVTGSGKTKVLLKVIDEILARGKSVIYLVPEISLTSQSYRLLSQRYADRVSVIHSGLSEGERADAWFGIRRGDKQVILGTRSAIFAPCCNLGAVIIDEEHDSSYKSDTAPRYHARDAARFRCAKNNALMILSSATPDVESFYKAKSGKYTLLTMRQRYQNAPMPDVRIEDLRRELRENPNVLVGSQLKSQIARNLEKGEQTILFVDRRGYQKFVSCVSCGHVPVCPNCSVSLTLHTGMGRRLVCHYCGHSIPAPVECPSCREKHLLYHGYGSQKVEEELRQSFPEARILRMDADTVTEKLAHDKILTAFKNQEADILLGTQMVAKGHDFPLVTLVGVVMADTSLYLSDYRAYEHSFSLLTQVIGRAGRSELAGRAFIQTLNPYHEVLSRCSKQDYDSFYESEIALRKALVYPPFCNICVFGFASETEEEVNRAVEEFNLRLQESLKKREALKFIVYGPFEAPIYKLKNVYRKRFVIKYRPCQEASALYRELLEEFTKKFRDKVKIHIDINPSLV